MVQLYGKQYSSFSKNIINRIIMRNKEQTNKMPGFVNTFLEGELECLKLGSLVRQLLIQKMLHMETRGLLLRSHASSLCPGFCLLS